VKLVVLSGGGGGARLTRGLADTLEPGELTVVGNVGDDLEVLGLHVSPDLDSLLYTLSGLIDEDRRWGRAGETWNVLESVGAWGGEDWFRLGDLDVGLHLVRTQALREGVALSEITARLAGRVGLRCSILPATDDRLRTPVATPAGTVAFQAWYVGRGHRDEVDAVEYVGAREASPAPGVLHALQAADAVVFAPSNPYLSIGPILAVSAIRRAIERRSVRCVAVSPLVGGQAVSGPAGRMLSRMAGGTTPDFVAQSHKDLIDALVIDRSDAPGAADVPVTAPEVELVVTSTLMHDRGAERRLADVVLEAACA